MFSFYSIPQLVAVHSNALFTGKIIVQAYITEDVMDPLHKCYFLFPFLL